MNPVTASSSLFNELKSKIENRQAKVGVIGLGYVGLPLALLFSEQRFPVTGFDIDQKKVDTIAQGGSYIFRIPATDIAAAKKQGFAATSEYAKISAMDAVIICVPTPLNEYHEPDLSFITNTAEAIAPHLRAGQLVVLESTTYPGTTEEVLLPILEKGNRAKLKAARKGESSEECFYVAFSPEREDPGNTSVARHDIPKVVGGLDSQAAELACALYGAIFRRTVPVSSPAAAEMTKLLENIYRCVNIALVNELKLLSQRMGIDIWEVIEAAKTKPFGFQPFYPGPGMGGHCIPVDPFYLSWKARTVGLEAHFIELAGDINVQMPRYVVDRLDEALDQRGRTLSGARILLLGAAYKPDIDDDRESPFYEIADILQDRGALVSYHVPHIPRIRPTRHHKLVLESVPLTAEALSSADAAVV